MAGKIIADTLETGAGADIATSYVVNGSAKAWNTLNGTGTISSYDSFNATSTIDNSTGNYSTNLTNAMSNAKHTASGSSGFAGGSGYTYIVVFPNSTTEIRSNNARDGAGEQDVDPVTHHTHGDLA